MFQVRKNGYKMLSNLENDFLGNKPRVVPRYLSGFPQVKGVDDDERPG